MRKAVALIAGLAILAFVNFGIYQRERLLTEGKVVLLQLTPVDPRSLMQGDYMALNFQVADQAFPSSSRKQLDDGHLIVALDRQKVAQFRRFADAKPLAPDEIALRYRVRGGEPIFATNAYFFEGGQAHTYENAVYGEFRVGSDGDMILTGMRDARFRKLAAPKVLPSQVVSPDGSGRTENK